jgi:hypothetical protein
MNKTYDREELKNMDFKQADKLPKEGREMRDKIKHIDENKKREFLSSINENLNDRLFTKAFIEKHLYEESEKSSKKDHAVNVAQTRQYRNSAEHGVSSIVDISDKEIKKELTHVLEKLTCDDVIVKADGKCELKKSLLFTTENAYPVREAPLIFSRKSREVGQLERKQAQVTLGLTVEEGSVKVNHFGKSIGLSKLKP